jgi:hypothetical protein
VVHLANYGSVPRWIAVSPCRKHNVRATLATCVYACNNWQMCNMLNVRSGINF